MRSTCFFLYCLFFFANSTEAQIKVGEWRDHLPYNIARRVEATPEKIYCITSGSLFYADRNDFSLHTLSTVNGLSDINFSSIRYSAGNKMLLIGYQDGMLDIITPSGLIHLADIAEKLTLTNKEIKQICIDDTRAYLACGFGIVVVNLSKMEISDTYFIGENGGQTEIHDICTDSTYLYAATDMGLFVAEKNNPNLVNYSYWHKESSIPDADGRFTSLSNFNGKIFALSAGSNENAAHVYYKENNTWLELTPGLPSGTEFFRIRTEKSKLVLVSTHWVNVYDASLQLIVQAASWAPRDAWVDEENTVWLTDISSGFIKHLPGGTQTPVIPNGPYNSHAFRMASSPSGVYASGGGFDQAWTSVYYSGEVYRFHNNKWSSWLSDTIRDVVTLVPDPANPDVLYAGTWGYGVYEFNKGVRSRIFDPGNSSLQSIYPGQAYCRVYGIAFDRDHNLWVTNSGVANPVSVRLSNGSWKSFPYGDLINAPVMGSILVSSNGTKWVSLPKGYGLFAFDEKKTYDNTGDDDYLRFQPTDPSGKVISSVINDMAEDLDGNIWLGTSSGPAVYYNPSAVFEEGGIYAQQILIPRNDGSDLADILLSTESVTAITIDGANRKWFGTQNSGAYLMSPDGQKQIHHFTMENSPLFSNTINDIAVDGTSGEVFFATPRGIISYRDAATNGGDAFGKVYVFPNPVREDYSGDIIVTGLASDVDVRITDIAGNLVFRTRALGGQAVWNGKNFDGQRVATGVYLIFCSNDDGTATYITKLLFIN